MRKTTKNATVTIAITSPVIRFQREFIAGNLYPGQH